jgi:hypothetical protein
MFVVASVDAAFVWEFETFFLTFGGFWESGFRFLTQFKLVEEELI